MFRVLIINADGMQLDNPFNLKHDSRHNKAKYGQFADNQKIINPFVNMLIPPLEVAYANEIPD